MNSIKRRVVVAVCFAAVGIGVCGVNAQSGRDDTSAATKNNKIAAQPLPSSTPPAENPADRVAADDGEVIKVNTGLVTIPVRVTDKKGDFASGLSKDDFKVFEDGVEKELALFSNEHQPFTVALALDMSYSTTFKIAEIQAAAIAFIDQLRSADKVMVISFDEEVHMLCEATNDRQTIYKAIKSTKVATGTSLYEAVDLIINNRFRNIEGRKAIILFTDGVDTTSRRVRAMNNLSDAMELDALIYPIRYDTYADVQNMKNGAGIVKPPSISVQTPSPYGNPSPSPTVPMPSSRGTTAEDYEKAREYLEQLATRTGGSIYMASTTGNLSDGFSRIASELREFYSLGIYPDDIRVGKVRKLKVKVDQPGLSVRSRDSYVVGKKSASGR